MGSTMNRLPAVMFRRKVYVGDPRHMDAINRAFSGMSDHQRHRISCRIADGKEEMLFGSANKDGTEWLHDARYQKVRMEMYGFL